MQMYPRGVIIDPENYRVNSNKVTTEPKNMRENFTKRLNDEEEEIKSSSLQRSLHIQNRNLIEKIGLKGTLFNSYPG